MRERVKVFTYVSGTGSTVVETRWKTTSTSGLQASKERCSPSASPRANGRVRRTLTVCVWYLPESASRPA